MSAHVQDVNDYGRRLDAAVEAREDGEPEDAAEILQGLLEDFPGDAAVTSEFARTMCRLDRVGDADAALNEAIRRQPDNFELQALWADMPLFDCDWPELGRRGEALRATFPPERVAYHLIHELLALRESFLWAEAADLVEAHWSAFASNAQIFPHAVDALSSAARTDRLEALLEAAAPEAWAELPREAEGNLRARVAAMRRNQTLIRETGVRLISIGQNCLPFQLPRRWGLNLPPHDRDALLPFDQGAFHGNAAADAIADDFASYADHAAYGPAYNHVTRGYTLQHRPSAVPFYHWRGPYWLDDGRARFFAHWERMVANWRALHGAGPRLFIFSLVGAGDLPKLIELAETRLLGPDAHLLIIDVQKHPVPCPVHPQVTYLYNPYPDDYDWIAVPHQNSAAGIAFETRIAEAIALLVRKIAGRNAAPAAAEDARTQRRMLETAIEANARHDHEACGAILTSLRAWLPDDPVSALEDAKALLRAGRYAESNMRLTGAIAHFPQDFPLRRFWAERPLHFDHDWTEAIQRIRTVRSMFDAPASGEFQYCFETELSLLWGALRWQEGRALVREHWRMCGARSAAFAAALGFLDRTFETTAAQSLIEQASAEAKAGVAREALETVALRLPSAAQARALLERGKMRLIPLGAAGHAYQILGRWGFLGDGDPERQTPFDMGAFSNEAVARAIETDFRAFAARADFTVVPSGSGGWMMHHGPTGTNFFTERGICWLKDEAAPFFERWDRLVENWRRRRHAGRRLFVFTATGNEKLERVVAAARRHLLGPEGQLVVIDLRPEGVALTPDAEVGYARPATAAGYAADDLAQYASAAGMRFENALLAPVLERIKMTGWLRGR